MNIEVIIEQRPREYIERQPPDARKQPREALHALENGETFPEPLEDEPEVFINSR